MAKPTRRNKKAVDYSVFGDVDEDDDDFANITVQSSKKSRRTCSESKKKKNEQQEQPHKEEVQLRTFSPNKTVSLEDKLYKRDMEIAVALSVNESSGNSLTVEQDAPGHNHYPNELRRFPTKSPTQGLRLGLSRLAKVKPLHPGFANI